MNTILLAVGIIFTLIVLLNILLGRHRRKTLKTIKKGYIGEKSFSLKNNLKKIEVITDERTIGDKTYIVVKTLSNRTLKIFEYNSEDRICTGFLIQTMETIFNLSDPFNYEKHFNIIEDDNFHQGIDISAGFRNFNPDYFTNGLTLQIGENRFGRIYRSTERSPSVKTSPLFIYAVSTSIVEVEKLIDLVKRI